MPELGSAVVSHELSIPSLPPATAASHQTVATPRRTSEIKEGPYIYKPLDASKSEIRILTILNDTTDDDPIRCTLTHVSLDDKKNHGKNLSQDITRMLTWYTAMSYTWGTLSRSHTILLDGHIFPVTANLEAALRNWSRDKAMQDWWIDAICINQEDMLERNSQVALMTRIYAQCRSVEIWLGEEADDSKLAMQVIQKLSDGDPVRGPGEKKVVLQEISKKQRVRHWRALTALFQRPWWQRVWIRQEVAIPRIATVHCG
ncbi:heterokaryon incompatibility protein-domain-containing protein, partial [Xylogone sp. PMI_703]